MAQLTDGFRWCSTGPALLLATTVGWLVLVSQGLGWLARADSEATASARPLICDLLIDDFAKTRAGSFPQGWSPKDEDEQALAQRTYRVKSVGGRHVLHARYQSQAVTIGRRLPSSWDPQRYPVLQWEWAALEMPKGGNEGESPRNDCVASVYAFWKIGFPFYVDSLKYTWSSSLEVGSFLDKALGHQRVIVRQKGLSTKGRFQSERAHLVEDHARAFDTSFRLPAGIAVLTDADDTESASEAYYANFRLCRFATDADSGAKAKH